MASQDCSIGHLPPSETKKNLIKNIKEQTIFCHPVFIVFQFGYFKGTDIALKRWY